MKANIEAVLAIRVPPPDDEEAEEGLHEFALLWYRFVDPVSADMDRISNPLARAAVWIRFGAVEQLERIQTYYPEAPLGPVSSFTEALLFAESWDRAQTVKETVITLLQKDENDDEENEMMEFLKKDTLEDL